MYRDKRAIDKMETLAEYQGVEPEDINGGYGDGVYKIGSKEFLVLTDEEATIFTANYIAQSLWAFNEWFLVDFMPEGVTEDVIKAVKKECENGNAALLSMVGNRFDDLVKEAISLDGRGHFLATYDGEEWQKDGFFIYRTN